MPAVTQILTAIELGQASAGEELLPLVYDELRRLAAQKLAQEKPGQTLQPTALVHEAWPRLVADQCHFTGARHFFLAAAEAMRRILVENARRKQRPKHGGHLERVDIARADIACPLPTEQLLAVDEAQDRLAALNPRAAEVVKLRFFAGLTEAQVAEHQAVSVATVERTWAFARAWLFHEIKHDLEIPSGVRENAPEKRV
ncbi:MAG: sigma-70 family RNA polymerase sigma factor [Verrucomicrobia bacterium]|nr:sigma-70 family RNA polymerase sigma factor [Verrucomicrobiota bacterium]